MVRLFFNKSFYLSVLFVIFVSFFISINGYTYGNSPLVWVIDSTYHGHGQTVANLVKSEAPNAKVHFEPVSNSRRVSTYKVARAIYKAVRNGADIINLSLGAPQMSRALAEAIRYAQSKGVVVVASAGNDGRINYPAALPGVVSVGASDLIGTSRGDINASGIAPNGKIGTSFSAPRIAGRIAHRMYEADQTAGQARDYVVNNGDNTRIGDSIPELTEKDVLLDLLYFALALDKIFKKMFVEAYKRANNSSELAGYEYSNPANLPREHSFTFSSPIWAGELRGMRTNGFFSSLF